MNTHSHIKRWFASVVLLAAVSSGAFSQQDAETSPLYVTGIAQTDDGNFMVTEKGLKQAVLYSPDFEVVKRWSLDDLPTGVVVKGNKAFVTTFGDKPGSVHFLDLSTGKIDQSFVIGSGANAPVVNAAGDKLYVLNRFQGTVSEIDLSNPQKMRTVSVLREPRGAAFDQTGKYLFVTNFLPQQRADLDTVAACVSVIEIASFKKIKDIQLFNGSNALRGICTSSDGKYIFVTHNLGRFQVPTSQLQQGWMNTSAMSVIDASTLEYLGAVLLDEPERGAAGIWGIAATPEKLLITHSGTHEVSVIDYPAFLKKFEQYPDKTKLSYDLMFMNGLRQRVALTGNGPREFVVCGQKAIIPTYFSDTLNIVSLTDNNISIKAMQPGRIESRIHNGEKYFNDAVHCFQGWQSCNGCHPGDARTDGMNWDLMNDGIGNPKNCKSMLYAHVTPPCMISGIRADAEAAVRAGYKLIQFTDLPEDFACCVDEYLKSLKPVPSPYLENGELSEKAERGRKVFEKMDCDKCHSGPYYTDMSMHRIGEDVEFEKGWDTPTLIEVWRTAPYLFDGRAATIEEMLEVHKHGLEKKKISKKELEELAEYVKSL